MSSPDSTSLAVFAWMISWAVAPPLMARVSRPDLFFSITVEPRLRDSQVGRGILRAYSRTTCFASAIGLVLALLGTFMGNQTVAGGILLVLGLAVQIAGLVYAGIAARAKVKPYQAKPSAEREAVLRPRNTRPVGGWLGQAGPFVVLAAGLLLLFLRPPATTPVQSADAGSAWKSLYQPVVTAGYTCLGLAVMFNLLARGVRRINTTGEAAEKEEQNLRCVLWLVLSAEYLMAIALGFPHLLPRLVSIAVNAALALVWLAIPVVLLYNGQGGWRLRRRTDAITNTAIGDRTPDSRWRYGIYFNPDDPAVFVERRFTLGWTVNMANPRAWVFLASLALFVAVGMVLSR